MLEFLRQRLLDKLRPQRRSAFVRMAAILLGRLQTAILPPQGLGSTPQPNFCAQTSYRLWHPTDGNDWIMTAEEVAKIVGLTGFITPEEGRFLTQFISEHELTSILELGFAFGASSCYLAAAVAERDGSLVSIDLETARDRVPRAEDLLKQCGCLDRVTLYHEPTSYTWRLMKFLQQDPQPRFDLCFIDGAHSWATDGFAFFLVDRLLVPGGWLIFDDLDWTFGTSPSLRNSEMVRNMPDEEKRTPQIRLVYELLVKGHPGYDDFQVRGPWAFARKRQAAATPPPIRTETVYLPSLADRVWTRLVSVLRRLRAG